MTVPAKLQAQIDAHKRADAESSRRFRTLSLDERGRLVRAACRSTAVIYESRIASGLPPRIRQEWPPSTWEFLKRHARRVSGRDSET
jgi:hypothetical protein